MGSPKFRFTDYDCIGFDLDNTVAGYNIGAMTEMEYDVIAQYLVERKGYSRDHLLQPMDPNFLLKGLIVDSERGNILRVAPDGAILAAAHGTSMLKGAEIGRCYPNKHWSVTDDFTSDPLNSWTSAYSEELVTLLDYYDLAVSLVFARCVDSKVGQKTYDKVWPDILEVLVEMFDDDNFREGKGGYAAHMKGDPGLYYHKCSDQLLQWLKDLKELGKTLFLITGSQQHFAAHTAAHTIGLDWRRYFDVVICEARKPGFFTMKRDFLDLTRNKQSDLGLPGIYINGNWTDLREFFAKQGLCKFLYIGDNVVQDIYTPSLHSECDTVCICEELEAEGVGGYRKCHGDSKYLTSSFWGSYFSVDGTVSNWCGIMKERSKICFPSLEYVATLPIDHEFSTSLHHL